jgi:DNA invertase Pin-like site-specific DNA recombinase
MRGVIYARYSSENQTENSIEGQLRECKSFAESKGIAVVGTYIDRALSAKTDDRPDFQRMIKDSAKQIFDVIIVWKLDRFARNRYDSAHYKAILRKNGVKVISATEAISEGAEGILLESLLEGIAEYYSVELGDKVKRGLTENALKARHNGGIIPYGLMVDEGRKYQPDPLTAPVVREIFERYADGDSVADIRESLSARGVKTKTGGDQLNFNSIRNMLQNRKYLGEYRYGEQIIPDAYPAVVTQELFDRAQERLERNKRTPAAAKAKVDYLLTTKLYCGKCGTFMVGESGTSKTLKKYNYYKCLSNKRKRGCVQKKAVKKDWIEQLVVQDTVNYVLQDREIARLAKALIDLQEREDTALPLLRKELEDTEKGLKNIADAIQQGIITNTTKQRLMELEARKSEIEISILQTELQKDILTEEKIIFWISRFKGGNVEDIAYQRAIIDIFVNAIYLYDDRIVLTYNFKSDARTISLSDIEISDLPQTAPPLGTNANSSRWFFVGETFAFVFSLGKLN